MDTGVATGSNTDNTTRFNKSPCWHHHATCCLDTTDPTNAPEKHQQNMNPGRGRPSWCEKWSGRGTALKRELSHLVEGRPPAHPSKHKVPPKTRPRQTYTRAHTRQTHPNARVPARGRHRWRARGGGNARKHEFFKSQTSQESKFDSAEYLEWRTPTAHGNISTTQTTEPVRDR
jgi:hypothetical protein